MVISQFWFMWSFPWVFTWAVLIYKSIRQNNLFHCQFKIIQALTCDNLNFQRNYFRLSKKNCPNRSNMKCILYLLSFITISSFKSLKNFMWWELEQEWKFDDEAQFHWHLKLSNNYFHHYTTIISFAVACQVTNCSYKKNF